MVKMSLRKASGKAKSKSRLRRKNTGVSRIKVRFMKPDKDFNKLLEDRNELLTERNKLLLENERLKVKLRQSKQR